MLWQATSARMKDIKKCAMATKCNMLMCPTLCYLLLFFYKIALNKAAASINNIYASIVVTEHLQHPFALIPKYIAENQEKTDMIELPSLK